MCFTGKTYCALFDPLISEDDDNTIFGLLVESRILKSRDQIRLANPAQKGIVKCLKFSPAQMRTIFTGLYTEYRHS